MVAALHCGPVRGQQRSSASRSACDGRSFCVEAILPRQGACTQQAAREGPHAAGALINHGGHAPPRAGHSSAAEPAPPGPCSSHHHHAALLCPPTRAARLVGTRRLAAPPRVRCNVQARRRRRLHQGAHDAQQGRRRCVRRMIQACAARAERDLCSVPLTDDVKRFEVSRLAAVSHTLTAAAAPHSIARTDTGTDVQRHRALPDVLLGDGHAPRPAVRRLGARLPRLRAGLHGLRQRHAARQLQDRACTGRSRQAPS